MYVNTFRQRSAAVSMERGSRSVSARSSTIRDLSISRYCTEVHSDVYSRAMRSSRTPDIEQQNLDDNNDTYIQILNDDKYLCYAIYAIGNQRTKNQKEKDTVR